jgi:transposase
VIRVVEVGVAARAAARQFVIGMRGDPLGEAWRKTGSFEAKSNKGQSRSPLKKHEEWLLGLVREEPDLTLEEIQRRLLEERQQKAGLGSVWRFFDRHGITFKKAFERPSRIGLCCRGTNGLGGRSTQARFRPTGLHGRNRHLNQNGAAAGPGSTGERLVGKIPHGHWKTTTFVASLRSTALTAPCVIDGPMNGMLPRLFRTSPGADPRAR